MSELIPVLKDQCEVSQSTMTYSAYDIYLDEEIKDPTYYRNVFQVLRQAQEGDIVRIYISSTGGSLNSAVMFKNNIESCRGEVVAIIEAEAYSAASLIALSCSQIHVMPYSSVMCHSAVFGSGGTVQNIRDHVTFIGKHAEDFMEEVYRDFLSPEELADLKKGRELWFDYQETGERLDRMFEARALREQQEGCGNPDCEECGFAEESELTQAEIDALLAEPKDVAPKKSRKKS